MTLTKHYRNAVIYPSIVVLIVMLIFSIIDNIDYESEYFTANSVIFISFVMVLFYSLIISALSSTIFLNKYETVRTNFILSALSWFLLPVGFIAITLIQTIKFNIKYKAGLDDDIAYIFILTILFLIGLIWSYIRYRKEYYGKKVKII